MKQIGFFRLGVTYAGLFIGAGLVSGQELWQFFGVYGDWGVVGLLLTMVLFFLFGVMVLRYAQVTGEIEMEKITIPFPIPLLRSGISVAAMLLLFGVYVIMAAGAGALLRQTAQIPPVLGSGIFCLLVIAVSLKGIRGVIHAFSGFIPILVVGTVGISLFVLWRNGWPTFSAASTGDNPLLGSFWFSSIAYLSYNFFGAIGLLASLKKMVIKRSTTYLGIGFGCVLLLLIAGSILAAIAALPGAAEEELPMLTVAWKLQPAVGILYAVLLLGGMFGSSAVSMVAILTYCEQKFPRWRQLWLILGTSVLAWIGSWVGFDSLIGVIYPVFGYIGLIALVGILLRVIGQKLKKRQKTA